MHPLPRPPWLQPRTAYLHVPFCGHHCGYCDFAVTAGQDALIDPYLDALTRELAADGPPRPVETLFIGGGTPTYLNLSQLERLLSVIHEHLIVPAVSEFSIESTPESLSEEKAALLARYGVNRVSVGVQSFRTHLLEALDRQHGVEQIPRAVDAVRRHVPRLSFDLIFAAPGQSVAEWAADLDAALGYEPDHISTYGLTYEKGTPLWKRRAKGLVPTVAEEAEAEMYAVAIDRLTAAGFEHYEVSNFARPGGRCRHNERYWANEAYFGYGVGAARYVGGKRELNVRDTKLYVRRVLNGESPTVQSEELPPRERAVETIAIQLRRADGIDRVRYREQTGFELDELVGPAVRGLVDVGLLSDDGRVVRLTGRGMFVADGVVERLMRGERGASAP